MAGSSTSTWTLSVLLLLPFFISFYQTSAAPVTITCNVTACKDVGIEEFQKNLAGLRDLKEKNPGCDNLNSSLSRLSSSQETCAFPSQFRNLLSLVLTECKLQKNDFDVRHIEHLISRLNIANDCPVLVNLYCANTTESSAPITSLEGLDEKLTNLLQKFREKCNV